MRISFDLDGTLFENESPKDIDFYEKLRYGSIDILKKIIKNNIELWIYTSSNREPEYIAKYFSKYGIKINIENIVNGRRHMTEVQGNRIEMLPLKYPSKYKIDLHVDDDISVKNDGEKHGFNVYLVKDNDNNWGNELWEKILTMENEINRTKFQKGEIMNIGDFSKEKEIGK